MFTSLIKVKCMKCVNLLYAQYLTINFGQFSLSLPFARMYKTVKFSIFQKFYILKRFSINLPLNFGFTVDSHYALEFWLMILMNLRSHAQPLSTIHTQVHLSNPNQLKFNQTSFNLFCFWKKIRWESTVNLEPKTSVKK